MLIDTHCHLDYYPNEQQAVIERAHAAGVSRFITIGCDIEKAKAARDIANKYDDVYFSAGIHPHDAALAPSDFIEQLKDIAAHPKCLAIGECGLDYYYDHSPKEIQRDIFLKQINLAGTLGKTLVIHVRDAFDECIDILSRQTQLPRIVIHCFTGNALQAKQFLGLGCWISISGIVTFKNPGELIHVVQEVPLERLLIETDSPYLSPVPHRGKRNEPAYVALVAQKIADERNTTLEEIAHATMENAKQAFSIR